MDDVNKRRRISFSLSKLECGPQEINSREIRQHLPFSANWNTRDKDWKTGIHFKTDVFAAVAVVDAKAPSWRRRQQERQKTIGLMSKTTTLHVRHAFLYISLPSLHNYDGKWPNFKFTWNGNGKAINYSTISVPTWLRSPLLSSSFK